LMKLFAYLEAAILLFDGIIITYVSDGNRQGTGLSLDDSLYIFHISRPVIAYVGTRIHRDLIYHDSSKKRSFRINRMNDDKSRT
jgi:hypothetical protein